ncbi:MAG TPA: DHA2 family efflux MFS transporter permease subunit [Stellaceae bacterium]|nr:DHA2 family efflux MFS transporter permease subunit [Stellaceae bacterium]
MSIGMFMAVLDIQIVASSLPEIQSAFAIPLDRLGWVQTAYLSAEIVAIPLTGWITRTLSTRLAFVVAVCGFTAASAACAASAGFWWLIPARAVQGFFGGFLIPLVFSAVFLMFEDGPVRIRATMIGGIMAMLAPTLGPTAGGFITDRYSWHWLFLINVPPGIIVAVVAWWAVDIDRPQRGSRIDLAAAPLLAVFLAALQVVLSEAPRRGWSSPIMIALLALCLGSGAAALRRCLGHPVPLVPLSAFRRREFAVGCGFSFVLGAGLYGATYILPLYLGVVRHHDPFEIGLIMMVTGAAQLVAAPVATLLERRSDSRLLAGCGYALLAAGLIGNGFMQPADDFWALAWQQAARGVAFMFCLLPTTSLALGGFAPDEVATASGLFNLMRNLGGAIGLAVVDTLIEQRVPAHVAALGARLQAGARDAAQFVGLPLDSFTGHPLGPIDEATREQVAPLVEHAGLTLALNEAWLVLGGLAALGMLLALVPTGGEQDAATP